MTDTSDAAERTGTPIKCNLCRHILPAGRRCGSPALRGEQFCYYHHSALPRPPEDHYNNPMRTQRTGYTDTHAAAGLDAKFPAIDTWANQFRGYEIVVDDPEFTSVCPKTGLPDFGHLTIRYMPRKLCLELKSLKEYLFAYRNLGIFQENVVNQVLDDVVKACNPVWAIVTGDFRPRGGISTVVEASYPRPKVK